MAAMAAETGLAIRVISGEDCSQQFSFDDPADATMSPASVAAVGTAHAKADEQGLRTASAEVDLAADGERFAVVINEGGGRSIHLIDIAGKTDTRGSGGWREPGNPVLDPDVNALAFTAQVAGRPAVVVVNVDDKNAWVAWHGGRTSKLAVFGVGANGRRVLLSADPTDLVQLFVIDIDHEVQYDVSQRKGNVESAALHRSTEAVVFTSKVGGTCAAFFADLTGRKRTDFLSETGICYDDAKLEDARRWVLIQRVDGQDRKVVVFDRKSREVVHELPPSCENAYLSANGALMAARCRHNRWGDGVYLFVRPEGSR